MNTLFNTPLPKQGWEGNLAYRKPLGRFYTSHSNDSIHKEPHSLAGSCRRRDALVPINKQTCRQEKPVKLTGHGKGAPPRNPSGASFASYSNCWAVAGVAAELSSSPSCAASYPRPHVQLPSRHLTIGSSPFCPVLRHWAGFNVVLGRKGEAPTRRECRKYGCFDIAWAYQLYILSFFPSKNLKQYYRLALKYFFQKRGYIEKGFHFYIYDPGIKTYTHARFFRQLFHLSEFYFD